MSSAVPNEPTQPQQEVPQLGLDFIQETKFVFKKGLKPEEIAASTGLLQTMDHEAK